MADRSVSVMMILSDLERRDAGGQIFQADPSAPQYLGSLLFWHRPTKFDVVTPMERGSATAPSQMGGAPALPNFWDSPVFMNTLSTVKKDQIGCVNKYGDGLILGGQPRPHPIAACTALADPNFAGSPLLMCAWLDL